MVGDKNNFVPCSQKTLISLKCALRTTSIKGSLLIQPTVMNLACVTLGMSMPEALIAATLNAAAALGRGSTHGAIQKGRVGDLIIINAEK
jgi:imidazolonepropionase-like amidohydrolase